jgi:exodeoxyribonuclease-3
MLQVLTFNMNGIRSAARKGFFEWVSTQNADVICLQELKAQEEQLTPFQMEGYQFHYHCAEKKGYSGVGIYSKIPAKSIVTGLGFETADREGRYIELDFGSLAIASLYLPSGTSGEERQTVKFAFLDTYAKHLQDLRNKGKEYIICGDWNIAHRNIDLKNWRGNQKNSGFLPAERAWLDELFGPLGFVDAFRVVNEEPDQYTWWSHWGSAREKNVGWRIDYQVVTPGLKEKIKSAAIYKDPFFSDHAPLLMAYDFAI